MSISGKRALVPLLLGWFALAGSAHAQETPSVDEALAALRSAPAHARAEKRAAVVAIGELAADGLLAEVGQRDRAGDTNYVVHCIIALGELKALQATDVLTSVLTGTDFQQLYAAAHALGAIWENGEATDRRVKQANAALLAALNSDLPPAAVYGPALALTKVNAIPLTRPESMEPAQLRSEVNTWMAQNASRLPPAAEQPWQLNLYTALSTADPAARQAAIESLRQKRDLAPISRILRVLADDSPLEPDLQAQLQQLLGELSGIPFPPEGATSGQEVATWEFLWLRKLKAQTDARFVEHTWNELERSLAAYTAAPSEEAAGQVKYYREAALYQLADPGAIPASASPKARNLVLATLQAKQRIADAVRGIEGAKSDSEKAQHLTTIDQEAGKPGGQEIGVLFLGRLIKLAGAQVNRSTARQMGGVLSKLSGVPCDLDYGSPEKRQEKLNQWLDLVRAAGIPVELPTP